MADDSLFRKAALDKLASPERLDVLMQVTSPKGWIALLTIAVLLGGVVAWSILGTLPERIEGEGILRGEGGLRQIRSGGEGQLTELSINVGNAVEPEQVVGRMEDVGAREKLRLAESDYRSQTQQHEAQTASENLVVGSLRSDLARADGQLAAAQATLKRVEEGYPDIFSLNRLEQERRSVASAETTINSINQQITSAQQPRQQRLLRLQQLRTEVEGLRTVIERGLEIRSTVSGKVVFLRKQVGDLIRPGDVIAELESASEKSTLEIVAFVSAAVGQRIQPGHPAQVTVAGIPREEFGFLRGTVRAVSQYAEPPNVIAGVMGDASISEASYSVVIDPEQSPGTPSGFAWSTGAGPHTQISGGARISVAVEVDQRAPISMVLPIIRGAVGG